MTDVVAIPRSDAPRVSFVIPSAAAPALLVECLRALEKNLPASVPTETIVVLDGAPAGSAERVAAAAPGARVLASSVRLGLARAANRGRRVARGEFLALLHDDSTIEPGWLEALLAAAEAHPGAGAFGGLVLFPDGTPQTAGVVLFRDGAAIPPWPGAPPPPESVDRARPADFCGSNALLVRTAAWDAAGGFDARFFPAYFVDADFAMALRKAGWWVLFEPRARNRHRRGSSSRRDFQEWVSARNRGLFVEKWEKELAGYEPWDGRSERSIEGALQRARQLAEELSAPPEARRADLSANGKEATERDDERLALEQDLALQRAWAGELSARLDACTARVRSSEGLFWWRLYVRLLPVLKPLRGLPRVFSRPGSSSRTG